MILDPEGVVRTCRWAGFEQTTPDWWKVIEHLKSLQWTGNIDWSILEAELVRFIQTLKNIPLWLKELKAETTVIAMVEQRIPTCLKMLKGV